MNNLKENIEMNNNSKCIAFETPIYPSGLAQAYVPIQKICSYYEPMEALIEGTIFPELNK
ncbi:MAG: spore coat associated protein CotJA [Anaerotignaceae bacterium]